MSKALLFISEGNGRRQAAMDHMPFTIGRLVDRDVVLPYPFISRAHAQIVCDDGEFVLVDQGSQAGTFVNGRRVTRHVLSNGDSIHFGSGRDPWVQFRVQAEDGASLHTLLGHIDEHTSGESGSLGKLGWFLEAARRLNNLGAISEIASALIETTLELTAVERGFVFLAEDGGGFRMAVGRNNLGHTLTDDGTISRSTIARAVGAQTSFTISDADSTETMIVRKLRTVICIPLRRPTRTSEVLGVLYLDSHEKSLARHGHLTQVDHELLTTIATEAAVLVENAMMAQTEEAGRREREELKIAAEIQQGLMTVRIPELAYAEVRAHNVPCRTIGGDFYDVISLEDGLYVVLADVSGKGVSAAILGSTLQGLIHAQVLAGQPLSQIAHFANRYICNRDLRKYATLVMLHVNREGHAEYINCGHVFPLLYAGGKVRQLTNTNVPVGLIPDAMYTSDYLVMEAGDRVMIVTDGITEAETAQGESYGEERLQNLVGLGARLEDVFGEVIRFTAGAPLGDDCTVVEVCYAACEEPQHEKSHLDRP